MSSDENTSKQAQSDASPNVEPGHVEEALTADNPPATAGPNDSLSDEKSKYRLRVEQLKLELARNKANHIRKLATLEKRVTGLKETVANQRNRISKLEADRKATETELKAKLRSVQLVAKENIGSLLARVSGGKNGTAKAKRDLLDYLKSLAKALKTGSGSDKKVKALKLANALL
jgi:TolA-binding protein